MTKEEYDELSDILINNPFQIRPRLKEFMRKAVVGEVAEKQKVYRTNKQNAALHKYLGDLANALEESGIDQKMFIDKLKGWTIPITPEFLKEIWKIKQEKMFMHESTTKLTTSEINRIYDVINKFTSQEFGVSEAFPSMEAILIKSEQEKPYVYPEYPGEPNFEPNFEPKIL